MTTPFLLIEAADALANTEILRKALRKLIANWVDDGSVQYAGGFDQGFYEGRDECAIELSELLRSLDMMPKVQ